MRCTQHSELEATGACVYCGKLFCANCLVDVGGKNYCKADVSKVLHEAKEANSAKANQPMVFMNAGGGAAASAGGARPGFNHKLHFILTALTCGVWAPIWVVAWLLSSRS
jgi:hypothetical protein